MHCGSLTRFRALWSGLWLWLFVSSGIPGSSIATNEASDSFGVDVLPIHPEGSLFPLGGALLLFAKHQVDLFGFDILSDMPCGKTIFVLLFSNGLGLDWEYGRGGVGIELYAIPHSHRIHGTTQREQKQKKERIAVRGKELIIPFHDAFHIS
jgi:hypothetical protein